MTGEEQAKAVALKHTGAAPTITATGTGQLACDIMEVAREHGVPMFENRALAELLASLALGEEIPRELYVAVAHILALAFELQGKAPPGWTHSAQGWEKNVGNEPY